MHTQQQLNRAKKLSDRADLVIGLTDKNNITPTRYLVLSLSALSAIALFILAITPMFATIIRFLQKTISQGNYDDNTKDFIPVFISAGIALISLPLIYRIVYPALKDYFTRTKENHKKDIDLLDQLHDALEKNNLVALQEILDKHTQGDETKMLTDNDDSLKMEAGEGLRLFDQPRETIATNAHTPLLLKR